MRHSQRHCRVPNTRNKRDERVSHPGGDLPNRWKLREQQKQTVATGWGDMDFNLHMKNPASLDESGDVRMVVFADNGFPMSELGRRKIGPVIMKDEIESFKKANLLQGFSVTFATAGPAADYSRFVLLYEFFRRDGKLCARATSTGGWLSLLERKRVVPPAELRDKRNA